MRPRVVVLALAASGVGLLALVACVDLFHSTSDILDACQLDAATDGCPSPPDAEADGGITDAQDDTFDGNFCSFSSAQARASAEAACAWLGACETPLGQNRYATCLEHAILAYDCNANPNMPVRGSALGFWTCMLSARDCGSVHTCAWGTVQPTCPATDSGPNTVCNENLATHAVLTQRGQCPNNGTTPQPHAENCAAWGQTCSTSMTTGVAECAGDVNGFGGSDCTNPTCNGTLLFMCDDAGDNLGVDCKNYGGAECLTAAGSPTCASSSTTPCPDAAPVTGVDCELHTQIAVGCPDGLHQQQIDCAALTEDGGVCSPTGAPGWDISRACFNSGASCPNDTCSESGLIESCDRGVSYKYQCGMPFKGCQLVSTADGDFPRAQCIAP
jgi:hypothetical protein